MPKEISKNVEQSILNAVDKGVGNPAVKNSRLLIV